MPNLKFVNSTADIGQFEVKCGKLRVTDPCYTVDTWCSGAIDDVLNGKWNASVGHYRDEEDEKYMKESFNRRREEAKARSGFLRDALLGEIERQEKECAEHPGRNAYIMIVHDDYKNDPRIADTDTYVKLDIDVGVDSGQAGFFDHERYAGNLAGKTPGSRGDEAFKEFYGAICELTLKTKPSAGCCEFGTVSQSGYGDGGYDCYVLHNEAGKLIAAFILFIAEDEESQEEDDEEDETV